MSPRSAYARKTGPFKCGHERSWENTTNDQRCRICYNKRLRNYMRDWREADACEPWVHRLVACIRREVAT